MGGKVKRSVLFFLFRLHGSGVLDISSYLSLTLTYLLFFLCNTLIVFLCSFLYLFLIARGGSRLGGMWGGAIITLSYQRIFRFRGRCIVGGAAKHRTVQSSISLTCTEILETPFLSYG